MQPMARDSLAYDRTTIIFHWVTFALVAFQFLSAWTIDLFPRGPLRVDARSVHICAGLLLGVTVVARIFWRISDGRKLPSQAGLLNVLAKLTHHGLYVLLIAMIVVGIGLIWVRGDSIFSLFAVPTFDPSNTALRHQVQNLHEMIGWIIIAVVGLHAAAAIFHHAVLKDDVLRRMVPRQ